MNIVDELFAIARALNEAGIEYAVCGGIAVGLHGWVRATTDIDLLVKAEDVARVLAVVHPLGYTMPANPMTFGNGTERERHVQRVTKIADREMLTLDLLEARGAYAGLLDGRIPVKQAEGDLWLVSREALLTMKRLAGRPKDLLDIDQLENGDDG